MTRQSRETLTVHEIVLRFCNDVVGSNPRALERTMRVMDRLDCWAAAIQQFAVGPGPNEERGKALISFWFTYGSLSIPRGLKSDLPCLVDALRHLLPPYEGKGMTLYRGELASRHVHGIHGISWTPNIETARLFARRRFPDEGKGVVLKMEATGSMIAVALRDHSDHTLTLEEDEYLIDPRGIESCISVMD